MSNLQALLAYAIPFVIAFVYILIKYDSDHKSRSQAKGEECASEDGETTHYENSYLG